MSCGKDHKKVILDAMKKACKPLRAGDIADMTGMDKKEINKVIAELKKDKKCKSPKRCYYTTV